MPWGEGEGRPQVEEWDQGEPEKVIGVLNGGRSGRWAGKNRGGNGLHSLRQGWR